MHHLRWITFNHCVNKHQDEHKVKTFRCSHQYHCVVIAQILQLQSLRKTEICLRANTDKLYYLGLPSGIARRFRNYWKQNAGQSAIALRYLFGQITFKPTYPHIGKLYYVVNTGISALAITTPLTNLTSADNGADSYLWWTWSQCVRTTLLLPFQFTLLDTASPPLYQEISANSVHLHQLGLSIRTIAAKLKVDEKTVSKAIRWAKEN